MPKTSYLRVLVLFALALALPLASCKKKEKDVEPEEENDKITTVQLTLKNTADPKDSVMATWEHMDGQAIDTSKALLTLKANTTYTGQIEILDRSQNPTRIVTEEIEENPNKHLFFYQPIPTPDSVYTIPGTAPTPVPNPVPSSANLKLTVKITDHDTNTPQLPVGLATLFTTGAASHGWMRVVLRNQPGTKNGTYPPGESELDVAFRIVVQ